MPIRVTQNMLNTQLLQNLNHNFTRMDKLQNQLATGRKINKPSDDPVGISFSMRYRSEISANEQYKRNLDSAISWLEYNDTVLEQAGNVMQRVRELSVQASNGTNPAEAMKSIKSEMDQLYQQMVNIGNSEFNGKYVFNGQKTNVKPYTEETATTDMTDLVPIQFEIGAGVKIPVNVTGNSVFGAPNAENNIFVVMSEVQDALDKSDYTRVNKALAHMDSRMDHFLEMRSDIGAKLNRVELADARLTDIKVNLTSLQSKTEDADMAEVITQLKMDENVYQSSLSAGAKLIKPSLIDFLR